MTASSDLLPTVTPNLRGLTEKRPAQMHTDGCFPFPRVIILNSNPSR
jgi:hypothetical protein